MRRRLPLFLVLLAALFSGSVDAQAPAPAQAPPKPFTLEVDVNVVSVTAVVFDKAGRFIRGLGPKDVQLLEDGVAQEVSYFREASRRARSASRSRWSSSSTTAAARTTSSATSR